MKDSGIEWIGEIPEGWEISPLFSIFKERKQKNYNLKETNILSLSYGKIIRRNTETNMGLLPESFETYNIVDKSNIILRLTDLQNDKTSLRTGLVIERGIITSAYIALESINTENVFFHYLLHCYDELKVFYVMGNGVRQNLKFAELSRLPLLVPPLAEQQRIADYLDAKCAYIDQCLELTRQSMEKLRAYKLSCITEAVTKGLDPDVPLKDSGVPWIGKICEHYEIIKIKYFTDIIRGKFSHRPRNDPRFYNGEYPFIQTGDIKISNKYITKYSQTLNDNGFNISRQFPSGTIVMAIAANVGDVAILDFDACFPDSVIGFTNLININKLFFYYTLITLKQVFIEKSTISTQLNLNIEIVNEVKIPYPPLPEQERIAAYLDKKCARIDALLEEKQALLDKLAEYKKSLIFECVTGKREVPSCWNR